MVDEGWALSWGREKIGGKNREGGEDFCGFKIRSYDGLE
jgi:hypothetical protein